MAAEINKIGIAVDIIPVPRPDIIFVAAPVLKYTKVTQKTVLREEN